MNIQEYGEGRVVRIWALGMVGYTALFMAGVGLGGCLVGGMCLGGL